MAFVPFAAGIRPLHLPTESLDKSSAKRQERLRCQELNTQEIGVSIVSQICTPPMLFILCIRIRGLLAVSVHLSGTPALEDVS